MSPFYFFPIITFSDFCPLKFFPSFSLSRSSFPFTTKAILFSLFILYRYFLLFPSFHFSLPTVYNTFPSFFNHILHLFFSPSCYIIFLLYITRPFPFAFSYYIKRSSICSHFHHQVILYLSFASLDSFFFFLLFDHDIFLLFISLPRPFILSFTTITHFMPFFVFFSFILSGCIQFSFCFIIVIFPGPHFLLDILTH